MPTDQPRLAFMQLGKVKNVQLQELWRQRVHSTVDARPVVGVGAR